MPVVFDPNTAPDVSEQLASSVPVVSAFPVPVMSTFPVPVASDPHTALAITQHSVTPVPMVCLSCASGVWALHRWDGKLLFVFL